jgi:hypothetical protein
MHKLICSVLSAVVIAVCRAMSIICLHNVQVIQMCVEGACQEEEEPSHYQVVHRMPLPYESLQEERYSLLAHSPGVKYMVVKAFTNAQSRVTNFSESRKSGWTGLRIPGGDGMGRRCSREV